MFWSLMIHVITLLLNTLALIYMFWNNYDSIFKKRYEKILAIQPLVWRGQMCFRDNKVTLFYWNIILPSTKFLIRHWCCLRQCNVTDKTKLLSLFYAFFISNSIGQKALLVDKYLTDRQYSNSYRKLKPFENQPTRWQK